MDLGGDRSAVGKLYDPVEPRRARPGQGHQHISAGHGATVVDGADAFGAPGGLGWAGFDHVPVVFTR